MDTEEMRAVVDALARINRSLNERFEKDADLYIPPERVEKIKRLIHQGNYQQIVKECLELKLYLPEVIANVLIKNAWLMKSSQYKVLRPIFINCDKRYLQTIMNEGVFDNKLEMPSNFRLMLTSLFLEESDAAMCQQMLTQDLLFLNRPELRAACIVSAIRSMPPLERYRRFKEYTKVAPYVLTEARTLKKLFPEDAFSSDVKEAIFTEDLGANHKLSLFWVNCLNASDGEYMFRQFVDFCRRNPGKADRAGKMLQYLFDLARKDTDRNMPIFAECFAEACDAMDGHTKSLLASKGITQAKTFAGMFQQALERKGIHAEKKELADIEKIIQILNTNSANGRLKAYPYLIVSFCRQHANDYKEKLAEIYEETSDDVFAEFCCWLVERTERNPRDNMNYLVYVIDNVMDLADIDTEDMRRRILRHIENYNIFQACKNMSGIEKVRAFVRENDFEMFSRLTAI